jgi:hypothetical protein
MAKESIPQQNGEAEVEPLQRAWSEALDRVSDLYESDPQVKKRALSEFTKKSTQEEIQKYLNANREILKPEEVFLLEVTIHLRSAKGFDIVEEGRRNEANI